MAERIPRNYDKVPTKDFKSYLKVLEYWVNKDRKQLGLSQIKNICVFIHQYYDGYLQDLFVDIVRLDRYSKEMQQKQNDVARLVADQGVINTNSGFVYLITNHRRIGWIKVGKTTNLKRRLQQYQTSDALRKFEYIQTWHVNDWHATEKLAIQQLGLQATEQSGEWFKIDRKIALTILASVV
jgi:predicted GIY-YIG superfamily endonuclease